MHAVFHVQHRAVHEVIQGDVLCRSRPPTCCRMSRTEADVIAVHPDGAFAERYISALLAASPAVCVQDAAAVGRQEAAAAPGGGAVLEHTRALQVPIPRLPPPQAPFPPATGCTSVAVLLLCCADPCSQCAAPPRCSLYFPLISGEAACSLGRRWWRRAAGARAAR